MNDSDRPQNLHLKLTLGEITLEAEGHPDEAKSWINKMREEYIEGTESKDIAIGQENGEQNSDGVFEFQERTLGEFYRLADEVNDHISKADAALLTGWYLQKQEGQDDFTKSEVEAKATSAGLSLGANPARDLSRHASANKANLNNVDTRDGETAYTMTLTGEDYIEEELLGIRD